MSAAAVTLCAIVRDEGPYLLEWVAYHRVLGFDQVVVYDNDSADEGARLLRKLDAAGEIEVRPWPAADEKSPQVAAYNHALRHTATPFLSFLDIDEFLHLHRHDSVGQWLEGFPEDTGAIGVNWRIFGSGGLQTYEPGLVLDRFTRCAPAGAHNNRHLKTVARVAATEKVDVHVVDLLTGVYRDAAGDVLASQRRSFSDTPDLTTAQVNHYCLKSREEFLWKRARGNANRGRKAPDKYTHRDAQQYWDSLDLNDEVDTSIQKRRDAVLAEMDRLVTSAGLGGMRARMDAAKGRRARAARVKQFLGG